jgi:hypothetical protein
VSGMNSNQKSKIRNHAKRHAIGKFPSTSSFFERSTWEEADYFSDQKEFHFFLRLQA